MSFDLLQFKHDETFISRIFLIINISEIPLRGIDIGDLSDLKAVSHLLTRCCLPLLFSVQFLSAWVLVCSELQSGPRSFIQNQMRVWQPLHLRHFSARQLRLGKSSVCSQYVLVFVLFPNIHLKCFRAVWVNAVQCERIVFPTCCFRAICCSAAIQHLFVSVQVQLIGELLFLKYK